MKRDQILPTINFANMRSGDAVTVPYTHALPLVQHAAASRVLYQREAKREVTYIIDEISKTVQFTMLSNTSVGGARAAKVVASIQGRRNTAPSTGEPRLTINERSVRSFWRDVFVAAISSGADSNTAESRANDGTVAYELMVMERNSSKERAHG